MDRLYADIGARMRSIRKTLKLTQSEVAVAVGIDPSFYGQLERGRSIPSLRTLLAAARVFGVEPADLLPSRRDLAGDAQQKALGRALTGLRPTQKRLLLDIVSDMADRFKTRRGRRTIK